MITLPQFATMKSDCRICIADKLCPKHKKIWDQLISEL